jgi:Holliday junction resolvase RusA-like endonuclease
MIRITMLGKPVPQGSKRWLPGGRMVEANSALHPWRATVTAETAAAMRFVGGQWPLAGPLTVTMEFFFTRPKAHYGTGRNEGTLKDNAPTYVATTPDLDKLIRAVQDGITDAGLWKDDSHVVALAASKRYAEQAGVVVFVGPTPGAGEWRDG